MAAVMTDANVVGHMDHTALMNSPIVKALLKKYETDEVSMLTEDPDAKAALDEIQKKTGINMIEDMKAFTFSAKVTGDDIEKLNQGPGSVPFVIGFDMAKEVDNEKLHAACKTMTDKEGGTTEVKDGLVHLVPPDTSSGDPELWAGATGSVALFGTDQQAVKGAMDRAGAGKGSIPSSLAAVKKGLPSGAQVWMAAALPDSARAKIKEQIESAGPQGAMFKAFGDLQSLALSAKAGSALTISLSLDVGSAEQATGAKTAIDAFVPMVKAMAANMVPSIMQKETPAEVSGTAVSLSIELNEADFPAKQ
jgi:hypothetical protein